MLTHVCIVEIYVRQIVAEQIAAVLQCLQLSTENSDEYLTLLDVLVQFCSDTDQKVCVLTSHSMLQTVCVVTQIYYLIVPVLLCTNFT